MVDTFLFNNISIVNEGKCLNFISFYRMIPRLSYKTKVLMLTSDFISIRGFFPQGGSISEKRNYTALSKSVVTPTLRSISKPFIEYVQPFHNWDKTWRKVCTITKLWKKKTIKWEKIIIAEHDTIKTILMYNS